jgi:tetratricopeptide (TPR) repeat protein
MSRLDRLPDETKWVAQQAAVIGREFLYRVLLRLSEQGAGVDADLSHLEREELIRQRTRDPEVTYIFKHALTQEVAYQSLLGSRRKDLHRRVAEAMVAVFAERLGELRSIIGEHFLRGEAWQEAADYLIEAGNAAARLFAHAEARLHYDGALEALTHLPETDENNRRRVDTTIKKVAVSFGADKPEEYLARLAQIEPVARALPAPDGGPGPDRLRLARVHFWIGRAHYYRNEPREAIRYYRDVLAVAQEFGDWELAAIPASTLGQVTLLVQGQYGKAEPLLRRAVEALERAGDWPEWTMALGYLAMALAARGAYLEGLAEGERALARAREMNNPRSIGVTHLVLSGVCRLGGDTAGMLAHSCAAIDAAERAGDWLDVYVGFGLRAWAESRLGRHDAAIASMAHSKEVGQRLGGGIILSDLFTAAEAEIALNAGRVEDALVLAEAAVAAATTVGNLFAEGLAHCTWGRALITLDPPRRDEAVAHLAASLQALDSGGDRLDAARTHLAWGQLCRDQGDDDQAREHLEQAVAQFEASGLPLELERARAILATLSSPAAH